MIVLLRNVYNLRSRIFRVYPINNNYTVVSVIRYKCEVMKFLNVAEKNDAAKNIAAQLSRGHSNRVTMNLKIKIGI